MIRRAWVQLYLINLILYDNSQVLNTAVTIFYQSGNTSQPDQSLESDFQIIFRIRIDWIPPKDVNEHPPPKIVFIRKV